MKRIFSLFIIASMLCALCSCGGKAGQSFTTILPGDVSSLDPQTATGAAAEIVIGSLFEGLCKIGEDGEAEPGVAESWEHNDDCTEFTFHLRDAKWDNGEDLTAEDFLFGIKRALLPETGAGSLTELFLIKNARAVNSGEADAGSLGVYVEDERTLRIELEYSYPDFPILTAGMRFMPCNQQFFEESSGHYGLSAQYVLGNGPFCFATIYSWSSDYGERELTLTKSATYKGEQSTVAGSLTYLIDYDDIGDDFVAALTALDLDFSELSESDAAEARESGCEITELENAVTGLLLNPECDALSYVGTRELLIKTIDREALLSAGSEAEDGESRDEACGIMPDSVLWEGESYYSGTEARYAASDETIVDIIPSLLELLELDSVPSITVLCADDDFSVSVANAVLISWNQKLGTAYNIEPVSESELESRIASGDYEAALYTLEAGGSSPFDVLSAFSSDASPQLLNSESFDSALKNVSFSKDEFVSLESTLIDEYVFYPVFRAGTYYALAPGVSGITVCADGCPDFSQARKS